MYIFIYYCIQKEHVNLRCVRVGLVWESIRFAVRKHLSQQRPGGLTMFNEHCLISFSPLWVSLVPRRPSCRLRARKCLHQQLNAQRKGLWEFTGTWVFGKSSGAQDDLRGSWREQQAPKDLLQLCRFNDTSNCWDIWPFSLPSHCEQEETHRAERTGTLGTTRRPRIVGFGQTFHDRQLSTANQIRSTASLFPCWGIFNSWASWQASEWGTDRSQTNLPLLDKTISVTYEAFHQITLFWALGELTVHLGWLKDQVWPCEQQLTE